MQCPQIWTCRQAAAGGEGGQGWGGNHLGGLEGEQGGEGDPCAQQAARQRVQRQLVQHRTRLELRRDAHRLRGRGIPPPPPPNKDALHACVGLF